MTTSKLEERHVKALEAIAHEFQMMNRQIAVLNRSIIKVAIRLAPQQEEEDGQDREVAAGGL